MGAAAGAASAPSLCCLERLHTDIWAPPGSWYNLGSDVKWCWEGALEFQRPVSPSLPLWTFTSQVTCPLRERETLAPLKGTGGPSMLQPGGESPECLWELGEGARKSKYRSPEIQIYLRGWCGVSALGGWAPLDRHLGLNQPWRLQEASPAPGHLSGLEGAGRGLTEAMGERSRREDAGVLARKASSACVGAPESWGRHLCTRMPAGVQERFSKNQLHKSTIFTEHCYVAGAFPHALYKISLYPRNNPLKGIFFFLL